MTTIEADPILCRNALRILFARYIDIIEVAPPANTALETGRLGLKNLNWMCQTAIEQMDTLPLDKTNRWLGFVQGCLAMRDLIDVDAERDISRPLFHAAYGGSDNAPAPLSRD